MLAWLSQVTEDHDRPLRGPTRKPALYKGCGEVESTSFTATAVGGVFLRLEVIMSGTHHRKFKVFGKVDIASIERAPERQAYQAGNSKKDAVRAMLQRLLLPQLNKDPDFQKYQETGIRRYTGSDRLRVNISRSRPRLEGR
jgi:hypothetical protein